ncbi:hypothetical protein OQX61_06885 [Pedobacter sp. PLR]|uniref:hypothetical protein n=1 Tax=Pedobacter sp. PLR TaxID=2994465 RepID=UPI002248259D|nr:hypothetical protein [Pedobacter sp. PLR]MCX2450994.1 hypothetical protein [Pedobacter sp. PLR]
MEELKFKYFDEINEYYFNQLTNEDKTLFEAKLILDTDLKREYAVFLAMISTMKEENESELMRAFADADPVLDQQLSGKPAKSKRSILIVAATIAVLGISILLSFLFLSSLFS